MSGWRPSGRELEILKALWDSGPASVREVHTRLCPHGELAFNTVQTVLRIMDEKGLVQHRIRGRTFIYEPTYTREQATAKFLQDVHSGATEQLVLSLLSEERLSLAELKRLESLIAAARRRKERESRRGG